MWNESMTMMGTEKEREKGKRGDGLKMVTADSKSAFDITMKG